MHVKSLGFFFLSYNYGWQFCGRKGGPSSSPPIHRRAASWKNEKHRLPSYFPWTKYRARRFQVVLKYLKYQLAFPTMVRGLPFIPGQVVTSLMGEKYRAEWGDGCRNKMLRMVMWLQMSCFHVNICWYTNKNWGKGGIQSQIDLGGRGEGYGERSPEENHWIKQMKKPKSNIEYRVDSCKWEKWQKQTNKKLSVWLMKSEQQCEKKHSCNLKLSWV